MAETSAKRKLTSEESEHLIAEYAPMVNAIARSLKRKLPSTVMSEDLVQDGYLGLLGAILQMTKARAEDHFQSYVAQRVRFAMLDGLRDNAPGSRRVRQEMRRVERAIHRLGHQLGRPPTETEIAEAVSMSLADYQALLMEAHDYTLLSLEDFAESDPGRNFVDWCAKTNSDPMAALERKAVQRNLLIAISELSPREEEMMNLYYVAELTMKSIAGRLGISEGRVSQIHAQAIAKLRAAVISDEIRPSLLAPRWRTA